MGLLNLAAFGIDLVSFTTSRSIGSFSGYCTIEEAHVDTLTVTSHPVEQGAEISDHAYKNPAQLTIRAGWSPSSLSGLVQGISDALSGDLSSLLQPGYAQDMYQQLLALQSTREVFAVTTGKRQYQNMLMTSLETTTDQSTENVLVVRASFREVIIVETSVTSTPSADVQADPQKTAAPSNTGTKQLHPASLSPTGS